MRRSEVVIHSNSTQCYIDRQMLFPCSHVWQKRVHTEKTAKRKTKTLNHKIIRVERYYTEA